MLLSTTTIIVQIHKPKSTIAMCYVRAIMLGQ